MENHFQALAIPGYISTKASHHFDNISIIFFSNILLNINHFNIDLLRPNFIF